MTKLLQLCFLFFIVVLIPGHNLVNSQVSVNRTIGPTLVLKLGMYYWGLKLYEMYINDDPGLSLIYFTARSNWVACTFEWGKLLQSHLMEEILQHRTILNE